MFVQLQHVSVNSRRCSYPPLVNEALSERLPSEISPEHTPLLLLAVIHFLCRVQGSDRHQASTFCSQSQTHHQQDVIDPIKRIQSNGNHQTHHRRSRIITLDFTLGYRQRTSGPRFGSLLTTETLNLSGCDGKRLSDARKYLFWCWKMKISR